MSERELPRNIDPTAVKEIKNVFSNVPFIKLIGMRLIDIGDGEATISLDIRDELRQPHGLLHGGVTASLIDTAMAFAVVSKLARDEKASTVDLNIHYLRPVIDGEISCTAKIVKAGRRLLTVSAEVFDDKGKLISTALSTYAKV